MRIDNEPTGEPHATPHLCLDDRNDSRCFGRISMQQFIQLEPFQQLQAGPQSSDAGTSSPQATAPTTTGATANLQALIPTPANTQRTDGPDPLQDDGVHTHFLVNGAPTDVMGAYKSTLENQGWSLTVESSGGGGGGGGPPTPGPTAPPTACSPAAATATRPTSMPAPGHRSIRPRNAVRAPDADDVVSSAG